MVSNLFDGLDFYSIANRALSHSVPCPMNQQDNGLVPVLYSNDGSILIVGGSSGSMRVLDSRSCETLQILSHDGRSLSTPCYIWSVDHLSTGDLIQAIVRVSYRLCLLTHLRQDSCTTRDGIKVIAAGISEKGSETTIKVWESQPTPVRRSSPPRAPSQEIRPSDVTAFRSSAHCTLLTFVFPQSGHKHSLTLAVLVGFLSFFFLAVRSDLWIQRWRDFLAQFVNQV